MKRRLYHWLCPKCGASILVPRKWTRCQCPNCKTVYEESP